MNAPSYSKLLVIGAGAGLASALLFAVTATLSPLALLLSFLAPLPIVIVSLGWTLLVGLFGIAIGAVALSLAIGSKASLAFAFGLVGPSWLLAGFALSRRPATGQTPSLGLLLAASAILSGVMVVAGTLAMGQGSYAGYVATTRSVIEAMIRYQAGLAPDAAIPPQDGVAADALIETVAAMVPITIGAFFLPIMIANLWAGARATAVSGRLPGSWMPVWTAQMPRWTLGLLAAALVLSFAGHFVGVLAKGVLGGLLSALALQALAAIHERTRGKAGRPLMLGVLYAIMTITSGGPMPFLALYGIVDLFMRRPSTDLKRPLA